MTRTIASQIAIGLLVVLGLSAPPGVDAAPPPGERTYFAIAMGLEEQTSLSAHCFVFVEDRLCSLDGMICGNWSRSKRRAKRTGLQLDLALRGEGEPFVIDGHARLDDRGSGSSLGGTARIRMDGAKLNFSFAAREVPDDQCQALIDRFEGDSQPAEDIVGSGRLATVERSVSGFHAVSASGAGRLVIERTGEESLSITAEDNVLPVLETVVRNGRLTLGLRSGVNLRTRLGIEYRLTVRDLDDISLTGSLSADATAIDADTLSIDLDGSSRVTIEGRAGHQEIRQTGSTRYEARDLESRTATVDLSGSSRAVLRVSDRLDGTVRDAALLEYVGDPQVDVGVTGVAVVRRISG